MDDIMRELQEIKKILLLGSKEVLNVDDVATLLGVSKDRVYHMVSNRDIPCYKRGNRSVFFKKREIEDWMLEYKQESNEEIRAKAISYCFTHPLKDKKLCSSL